MKILAVCPNCGCVEWDESSDGRFVCKRCGLSVYAEEMILKREDDIAVVNDY